MENFDQLLNYKAQLWMKDIEERQAFKKYATRQNFSDEEMNDIIQHVNACLFFTSDSLK